MRKIRNILLLLVCFIVFLSTMSVMSVGDDQSTQALANPAQDASPSTIRVKLSVGSVPELALTLNGSFHTEAGPLASGTYVIRIENNAMSVLNSDGVALITSPSPLMIQEDQNPDPAVLNTVSLQAGGTTRTYLGSMKFWLNGLTIDVVNHVDLEKYLYGVVAYEMSNAFPLEALKAQAVSARCYAYKRLEGTRADYFDIGDTSGDQVYKGYNTTLTNVKQAVDATAGQVLTYNGAVIIAYFSASNGGQTDRTENVWSSALPYFKIREDPYDLANPSSLQKWVYFPIGSSADKTEDFRPVQSNPIALGEAYGASKVYLYPRTDMGSTRIASIKRGERFLVYEQNSAWTKVKYGEQFGFIRTRYMKTYYLNPSTTKLSRFPSAPKAVVRTGDILTIVTTTNFRTGAKTSAKIIAKLPALSRVTVVSAGTSWHKVSYNGRTGYVYASNTQLVMPSMVLTAAEAKTSAVAASTARYSQDDMDTKLVDFLRTQAAEALRAKNASMPAGRKYDATPATIKIKSILDMTAIQTSANPSCDHHVASTDGPAHDASNCPSIDFTGVKMKTLLKVQQEDASKPGGYDLVDYTWEFTFVVADFLKSDLFPQWQVFSPGNGLRIYAVEKGVDPNGLAVYKLTNRRYGHGIGLSQRGAQQRAKDPNPAISQYQNILAFYYPNTTLVNIH